MTVETAVKWEVDDHEQPRHEPESPQLQSVDRLIGDEENSYFEDERQDAEERQRLCFILRPLRKAGVTPFRKDRGLAGDAKG
jgi:hypothetical protein